MTVPRLVFATCFASLFVVCTCATPAAAQVTIDTDDINVSGAPGPARIPAKNAKAKVEAAPGQKAEGEDDFEFDPLVFGRIKHRSLEFTEDEIDAFYRLLEHARKVDYSRQVQVAHENVARHEAQFRQQPKNARIKFSLFADVFTNPEDYTGELLFMTGYVRKLIKHPLDPEDPHPIQTYEAWMYTPDSQHNPVVIVFSELPPNMPVGGDLVESIDVAGYFFKIDGYHAQDLIRVAPMLLAKTIEWKPRIVAESTKERIIYFVVTGGFVFLMIVGFWWISNRSRKHLQAVILEPEDFDPSQLNSLAIGLPPSRPEQNRPEVLPQSEPQSEEVHQQ
jgi:hypothetical protein